MFDRPWIVLPLLAAAIGGPYVAQQQGWLDGKFDAPLLSWGGAGDESGTEAAATQPSSPPLPGTDALPRIFRFDLTPNAVLATWPSVTTTVADLRWQGMRVPLATGAAEQDVAGSLTYYFDQEHRVRRITFHGQTGNPTALARVCRDYFEMQPEPSLSPMLLTRRWNGGLQSVLLVRPAAVLRSDQPHTRYEILLELNHPDNAVGLSAEAAAAVGPQAAYRPGLGGF